MHYHTPTVIVTIDIKEHCNVFLWNLPSRRSLSATHKEIDTYMKRFSCNLSYKKYICYKKILGAFMPWLLMINANKVSSFHVSLKSGKSSFVILSAVMLGGNGSFRSQFCCLNCSYAEDFSCSGCAVLLLLCQRLPFPAIVIVWHISLFQVWFIHFFLLLRLLCLGVSYD